MALCAPGMINRPVAIHEFTHAKRKHSLDAQIVLRHAISRRLNLTLIESDNKKTPDPSAVFFSALSDLCGMRPVCFQLLVSRSPCSLFSNKVPREKSPISVALSFYMYVYLNESIKFYGDAAKVAQRGGNSFLYARHEFFSRTFRRELATWKSCRRRRRRRRRTF